MGSVFSRIMRRSNSSSSDRQSVSQSCTRKKLQKEEDVMKSDSEEMLSFSYNSQTADVSISSDSSHSRSSQGSRSASASSMSSSAMDCLTAKSTSSRKPLKTDSLVIHSNHPSDNVQPDTPHVANTKPFRPITSHYQSVTSHLHKCQSEPLSSLPGPSKPTHRTVSEQPLLPDVNRKPHQLIRNTNEAARNTTGAAKHMEGASNYISDRYGSRVTPLNIGDGVRPTPKLEGHSAPVSSRHLQSPGSVVKSTGTREKESPVACLVRSMEHVASVMKKKIFPPLYEANKSAFVEKILPTSQVQYGYQGDRYITVGSGEFGEVLYGKMKSSGKLVAIKALKRDKSDMYALLQEAFLLQIASTTGYAAHYRGLASFCALGGTYLEWAIVCDFVGSSSGPDPYDFRQTLKQAHNAPKTIQLILDWVLTCSKIAFAVKQFHAMDMLLNDIKADNILLRPSGTGSYDPVFVDFGLASIGEGITLALEVNDSNRAKILKEYSHIAPEVLFGGETNVLSDMFSLGKALSLVSEAFPLEPLVNIISRCTLWNVDQRPSIDELIDSLHWVSNNMLLKA